MFWNTVHAVLLSTLVQYMRQCVVCVCAISCMYVLKRYSLLKHCCFLFPSNLTSFNVFVGKMSFSCEYDTLRILPLTSMRLLKKEFKIIWKDFCIKLKKEEIPWKLVCHFVLVNCLKFNFHLLCYWAKALLH